MASKSVSMTVKVAYEIVGAGEDYCVLFTLSFFDGDTRKYLKVGDDRKPLLFSTQDEAEAAASDAMKRLDRGAFAL